MDMILTHSLILLYDFEVLRASETHLKAVPWSIEKKNLCRHGPSTVGPST